ncbi:MAG: hypothetical protein ACKOA2_08415 [Ilumatobacteraceae bacterium]
MERLPEPDELARLSPAALEAELRRLDVVRRRCEALLAEGVGIAARRGDFTADGHRSVVGWCRGVFRWSTAQAVRAVRLATAMQFMGGLRAAAMAGRVSVGHLDEIGRVAGNVRVHAAMRESDELLTGLAQRTFHREFKVLLHRWEQLADADGAAQSHAVAHESRMASVALVGEQVVVEAQGGTLDGVFLREVLDRFVDAEFRADLDEARERVGRQVTAADLTRTHRQRTFDALVAVFRSAASAPLVVESVDPIVNIVVDMATAERLMAQAAGVEVAPASPLDVAGYRCDTADGVAIAGDAMVEAMLVGRVRRVVVDTAGVVIDLGRSSRLFRNGARDAVMLGDLRCLWPGCDMRTGRCHSDHSVEWADGGTTSSGNGGRACSHHNLFKSANSYVTRRDDEGRWHVYRPDGTEVASDDVELTPAMV